MSFLIFAIRFVTVVANTTTDILLNGINMAAIKGVNFPVNAKLIPMILYEKEIINAAITIP